MFEYCVYYEKGSEKILDYFPKSSLSTTMITNISVAWENPIYRKILKFLSSNNPARISDMKQKMNHSLSTLHDAVDKLEDMRLVKTKLSYEGKKQRFVYPRVLFVTQNAHLKRIFKSIINQGIWVDVDKTRKIIDFLKQNPKKFFSVEEISAKTEIPVDEVKVLLENYDSLITRAMSEAFKDVPFEKVTLYRFKESYQQ